MSDQDQQAASPGHAEPTSAGSDVDVAQLADKVYRLLANEIRLGLARGELAPSGSAARGMG